VERLLEVATIETPQPIAPIVWENCLPPAPIVPAEQVKRPYAVPHCADRTGISAGATGLAACLQITREVPLDRVDQAGRFGYSVDLRFLPLTATA